MGRFTRKVGGGGASGVISPLLDHRIKYNWYHVKLYIYVIVSDSGLAYRIFSQILNRKKILDFNLKLLFLYSQLDWSLKFKMIPIFLVYVNHKSRY